MQEEAWIPWQAGSDFPGSAGGRRSVDLVGLRRISKDGATKSKWEMVIDLGPQDSAEVHPGTKLPNETLVSIL